MKLHNLKVLSESEIEQIHQASLDILENIGVTIYSDMVVKLLEENGAQVAQGGKTAKLPRGLVGACLKTIPPSFLLFDRNSKPAMTIGDGEPRCASGHNAIYMLDSGSGERRNSTLRDVEDFAMISDKLGDIDIVGVPVMPQDVTPQATLLYAVKALYENTSKPLFFSTGSRAINASILQMMKVVSGVEDISRCPNAICQLSPTSPLFWEKGAAEAVVDTAQAGVPLTLLPEPMSGVSAPYSVAGMLAVHNAEVLSGVVIAQLARPGAPLLYGSSWTTFDMMNMCAIITSPETSMLRIAGYQMAKFYRMPSHTTAPNSDSNCHDEQNAWEKAISSFCSVCAGNDVVMNAGMFASGLTVSLEQLVLDDEINGIVRRIRRGIQVDSEAIAVDVVRRVGPHGSFLTQDHTLDRLRTGEFRKPKLGAAGYGEWLRAGAPDSAQTAAIKVKALLERKTDRLDAAKSDALQGIIREYETDYR